MATPGSPSGRGRGLGALRLGRLENRLDDQLVPRAAAEVAGDGVANLVLGRIGVLLQELQRGQDHPRSAEAALKALVAR